MFQAISDTIFRAPGAAGGSPKVEAEESFTGVGAASSSSSQNCAPNNGSGGGVNVSSRAGSRKSPRTERRELTGSVELKGSSVVCPKKQREQDKMIKNLRDEVTLKDAAIQALSAKIDRLEYDNMKKNDEATSSRPVSTSSQSSSSNKGQSGGGSSKKVLANYSHVISDDNKRKKVNRAKTS